MGKEKLFKGGEFLITDALPEEVFTPEDFTKDQKLVAKSAEEFGIKELLAKKEEMEELNPPLVKEMLKMAGELGFLGADMPEVFGGSELDKVSSMLIAEKLCSGVAGFMAAYGVQTGIGSLRSSFSEPRNRRRDTSPRSPARRSSLLTPSRSRATAPTPSARRQELPSPKTGSITS
jgi:hypothetical protein